MNRLIIGGVLALSAGVMGVPAHALRPGDPVQPAVQGGQRALALSKLLVPEDLAVQALTVIVRRDVPPVLRADEGIRALEARYPGIVDAMIAAALPELVKQTGKTVPLQQAKVEALLAAKMTPAEIETAYAFYAGPTGQKVVRDQFLGFDAGPMIKEAIANERGTISPALIEAAQNEGATTTTNRMTPEDEKALLKLMNTSAFLKIKALGPEIQRVTAEVSDRADPEGEARVQALMNEALEKFIREADK